MTYPLRERLLDIRNHSETVEEGLRPFPVLRAVLCAEADALDARWSEQAARVARDRMSEGERPYFKLIERRNAR